MKKCMICNTIIDETNDTKEHIIPASIGGIKTVKGFICRSCNNSTGEIWDAELAKQLAPFTVYFGIKRQNKKLANHTFETTDGKEINVFSDGRMYETQPKVEFVKHKKEIKYRISARNKDELRKILKGISKKYKKFDLDEAMGNYHETSDYPKSNLVLNNSFGGPKSGKSLIKTAMALIYENGISLRLCNEALDYLLNDGEPCFGYYYENDLVVNRDEGLPLNCVYIKGSSKNNNILAYIEYYGFQRVVCCLSKNYSGEDFSHIYAIDPLSSQEINLQINLDFNNQEIQKIYNYEFCSNDKIKSALLPVMNSAYKRSIMIESDRIVENSIKTWCLENNIDEDEEISEEQTISISSKIANDMLPLIMKNIKMNDIKR